MLIEHTPLICRTDNSEELKILSAHLQDALVPHTCIAYDKPEKMFRLLINRFCWEAPDQSHQGQALFQRIHSVLFVPGVEQVKSKGFQHTAHSQIYALLCVKESSEGLILHFSGQRDLHLITDCKVVFVKDLHEPWHTPLQPLHEIADAA